MSISSAQRKEYRTLGHKLNPIVTVAGNGLSEGVQDELQRALEDHELIKIKLAILDRDARKQAVQEICQLCRCEVVQEIGKVALIYRAAKKPDAKLSNLLRSASSD
jgi:RNA-binding protein